MSSALSPAALLLREILPTQLFLQRSSRRAPAWSEAHLSENLRKQQRRHLQLVTWLESTVTWTKRRSRTPRHPRITSDGRYKSSMLLLGHKHKEASHRLLARLQGPRNPELALEVKGPSKFPKAPEAQSPPKQLILLDEDNQHRIRVGWARHCPLVKPETQRGLFPRANTQPLLYQANTRTPGRILVGL